ncbi:MAG: DUF4325 domain-containing protein [Clostridia bacterium]|jgi:anti-sigma regulatory factor (Ser/Thr protein kinase)|nr:DUF4325 domain-containing protein [Clostridia bacterium]
MKMPQKLISMINDYIMSHVNEHSTRIVSLTMDEFSITRPTANKYIRQLIEAGYLEKTGTMKRPVYKLTKIEKLQTGIAVDKDLEEDAVYRNYILPLIFNLPDNIRNIIQYGVTEMVNNVIEHSGSDIVYLEVNETYTEIELIIGDSGIGIFQKIQNDLGLELPSHAIFELSKGKFTSDPSRHTGEGIFFTSRIFDSFAIMSKGLCFLGHEGNDYLAESRLDTSEMKGTLVFMNISKETKTNITDVFNKFSDPDSDPSFHKTIISVKLMQFEGEALMSRSQARRLLARVDHFKEAVLDFQDVILIGQAFADEIFRVFQNAHPDIRLISINQNPDVERMIQHVKLENGLN